MNFAFQVSKTLSIAAFFFYGIVCLVSPRMVEEFTRFGLASFRKLIGSLEILGALGLLAGYFFPPLVAVAAGGLTLLMVMGVLTRIRVRDSLVATLPAVALLLVNAYVFGYAISGRPG